MLQKTQTSIDRLISKKNYDNIDDQYLSKNFHDNYEFTGPMDIDQSTSTNQNKNQAENKNCCTWLTQSIRNTCAKTYEYIKSHKKAEIKKRKIIEINYQLDVLSPTIFYQAEKEEEKKDKKSESYEQNEFYNLEESSYI